jgi:hypothetical protein
MAFTAIIPGRGKEMKDMNSENEVPGSRISPCLAAVLAISSIALPAASAQDRLPGIPAYANGGQAASAQPTLDQVLDKYVQAIGGREAIEKLTTRSMKGSVENPSTGETGSIEVYRKAPDKEVSTINIPSNGPSTRGYDGKVGWTLDPDSGVSDMGATDLAAMKLEAEFHREIRLKDLFPKMTLAGTAKVGDREAYIVDAPQAEGTEKLYFDVQSGLLLRDDVPAETDGGRTTIESSFEDYRAVGGVKLPYVIRQTSPDFDLVIKYAEIKHDVPIDDGKFQKPKA